MKIIFLTAVLLLSGCSYLAEVSIGGYGVQNSASISSIGQPKGGNMAGLIAEGTINVDAEWALYQENPSAYRNHLGLRGAKLN